MRTLIVTVILFFALIGGGALYLSVSDAGHEYDMKFVLPVDMTKMPQAAPPPQVAGQAEAEAPPITAGRVETPPHLRSPEAIVVTGAFPLQGQSAVADERSEDAEEPAVSAPEQEEPVMRGSAGGQ